MERGFHRVSDPQISTEDWLRLNFNSYSTSIFALLVRHDMNLMEDLHRIDLGEEPEEPEMPDRPEEDDPAYEDDPDMFQMAFEAWERDCDKLLEEYQEDLSEWESAQQLHGWPTSWGTVWGAANHNLLREALVECGFVVYQTSGELEDFGDLIFGVDGGGYNFYADHWIPLRATLCRHQWAQGYLNDEDFSRVLMVMAKVQQGKGGVPWTEFYENFTRPVEEAA